MAKIEYYFATLSPYTYLAEKRLEQVAARCGAEIVYKPVDLMGLFGETGGVAPKDRHVSRQEYRAQDLLRQSAKLGLDFNLKPAHFPTNMAPSSYAVIAAQNAGGGDLGALVFAFTRACWAEEKNIADDDVIRDCLKAAGFDPNLAETGLLEGAETYASNLEDAIQNGVFGAPFYVTEDGQRFWGQDRLDDLEAHLTRLAG